MRKVRAAGLCLVGSLLAWPAPAEAQIRNAPNARALEVAAYVFAATNICGYRIQPAAFEELMARQGVSVADVSPQGPFAARVRTIFTLMSNGMMQNRQAACEVSWKEFGEEGFIAKGVIAAGSSPQPSPEAPKSSP